MHNLFSYESKFSQALLKLADYILLNLLYLICCIPVITIGAAQAGLYTALNVIADPDNDESPFKAYFRGFRNGFGHVTILWCIATALIAILIVNLVAVLVFNFSGFQAPVWVSVAGLCICIVFQTMIPLFHFKFTSPSLWQLLKNVWFTVLGHPIRSILAAVALWLPIAIGLLDLLLFAQSTIAFVAVYYSLALRFNNWLMKKPFQQIVNSLQQKSPAAEAEQLPEETK